MAHTAAGDIPLTGRVVDRADVLPAEAEADLSSRLSALEAQTSDQVVVVTLPRLNGAKIEDVGLALGRGWKIGRGDVDNGVILLLAPNERRVRIEVGYGLEALLTDERAARVIRDQILPRFSEGNLQGGIDSGVNGIITVLRSDPKRPQYRSEAQKKVAA